MSNGIRYDSLLVRDLAAELHERLAGRRASLLRLDPDRRAASLETDRGGLVLALHPLRGWIVEAPPASAPELYRLHRNARVGRVHAPDDERILRIDLAGGSSATRPIRALVVELMTNQMNLLALGPDERIVAALWRRSAGGRELRPGGPYALPRPSQRAGAHAPLELEEWLELLGPVPAEEEETELVRRVAWTSRLNAAAILGAAAADPARTQPRPARDRLVRAHARYLALVNEPRRPVLLEQPGGVPQPYPLPLPGRAHQPADSLLGAMSSAAGAEAPAEAAAAVAPERLDRLRRRLTGLESRLDAMGRELERAQPDAEALRARADLLLARLHEVPRGAARIELAGFDGEPVELELDPALSPADNAQALYAAAGKRAKAAATLPGLLARAERERDRLADLLQRAERDEAREEEIEAALPPEPSSAGDDPAEQAPFRRYRTSGGLEVRVGRSSRGNDELTFHHSSPDDIWLHARDAAGAHVILRWPKGEANPPPRDLGEAAVLAALHSRARTSGTVPVDWTRRKYVRKPRKAPPGLVLPDRVRTVFVEPDPQVERRMRD